MSTTASASVSLSFSAAMGASPPPSTRAGFVLPRGIATTGIIMSCRNCDAPINLDTIGEPGGCNPIPLASSLEGQEIVVTLADLMANQAKFAGQ